MKWLPLLALIVSPLVSAVTLDELQQRFTEQPVVRAHFEQVRTTTGYTIQVAVEEATREMCFVSPAILFERMGVSP